jgi:hypothetical protein
VRSACLAFPAVRKRYGAWGARRASRCAPALPLLQLGAARPGVARRGPGIVRRGPARLGAPRGAPSAPQSGWLVGGGYSLVRHASSGAAFVRPSPGRTRLGHGSDGADEALEGVYAAERSQSAIEALLARTSHSAFAAGVPRASLKVWRASAPAPVERRSTARLGAALGGARCTPTVHRLRRGGGTA